MSAQKPWGDAPRPTRWRRRADRLRPVVRRRALGAAAVILVAAALLGLGAAAHRSAGLHDASGPGPTGRAGAPVAAPGPVAASGSAAAGVAAGSEPANPASTGGGGRAALPPTSPSGTVSAQDLVAPKVVENASVDLTIRRGSLDSVVGQLTSLAAADGGFVAQTDTSSGPGLPSARVTLRIPDGQYAAATASVRNLGKVTSFTSSGQDVTSQYVDLQSQIQALQASQKQYETIMTRATTVGDILAVQSQLDSLDSQLQQLEGQAQVLDSEASYATIAVSAVEAAAPGQRPAPRPASGLARAWQRATAGFAAGFDGLVVAAGPLAFALVLLAALALAGRLGAALWGRRRRTGGGVVPSAG